jgi:DNA-binding transcriptional MerR regulator
MALTVSALADQAGLSADIVRYYKRVGLLPEPAGRPPATGCMTRPPSAGCG